MLKDENYTQHIIELLSDYKNDIIIYNYFKYVLEKRNFDKFSDIFKLLYFTQNL